MHIYFCKKKTTTSETQLLSEQVPDDKSEPPLHKSAAALSTY